MCLMRMKKKQASSEFRHIHAQWRQSCIDNILTNMPQSVLDRVKVDHNDHSDGHAALLTSIVTEGSGGMKWTEPAMAVKRRRFKINKENFRRRTVEEN